MVKTINILAPSLTFGTFGMASCQVEIDQDGVPLSARQYFFNIGQFSAFVDSIAPNYGSVHFGKHLLDLSNGDYNVIQYNGINQATPYLAMSQLASAVADLA